MRAHGITELSPVAKSVGPDSSADPHQNIREVFGITPIETENIGKRQWSRATG